MGDTAGAETAANAHLGSSEAVRQRAEQWIARGHDPDLVELVGLLRHATYQAQAQSEQLLARAGLHRGQFDVLAALYRAGDDAELTQAQLAEAMLLTRAGMKKRVDGLIQIGLIARRVEPEHPRKQRLLLTDRGHDTLLSLLDGFFAAEAAAFETLGDSDRRDLRALLAKMVDTTSS
ncbi:MarR family winged helix-turn-helix transcriptional regulator [Demequina capsici]|uniref:MarR family winged helix-turn-helix transcriptional regulator n=1 Tax=Demequina capsici TaxID=3075620 RepID=A0AA96F7V3_9MICO|nr:MarR family winged helix-turn-helix transcriptional regulator [Demequina sp. OYTSA14]WNM23576.1 MarR family winged helix-turn-helix transcriptional regulator [Demequina sp. OYTSA14]